LIGKKGIIHPLYGKLKSAEFIAQQTADKTGLKNPMSKVCYALNLETGEQLGPKSTKEIWKGNHITPNKLREAILTGKPYKN
jgi:hypothetical protein